MLPTSTQLLGAVVDAFRARKEASTTVVRCVLRNSTSRRGFVGRCETRRWCCPLTAFTRFLVEDDLVPLPSGVEQLGHLTLFLPIAQQMIQWDRHAPVTELAARAHLRTLVIELAPRVTFFAAECGAHLNEVIFAESPAWADPARRSEPLVRLIEATFGEVTQASVAQRLGAWPHAVGRWLSKGERPKLQSIREIARLCGRRAGVRQEHAIARTLRWHYGLAELADRLRDVVGGECVQELARVFTALVHCSFDRAREHGGRVIAERFASLAISPYDPPFDVVLEHARRHGATPEWERDACAVRTARSRHAASAPSNAPDALAWLVASLPRHGGVGGDRRGSRSENGRKRA
jgi:hypothetical protein